MAQAMIGFLNFSQFQSQSRVEQEKRHVDSIEHLFRKDRKSARPRFRSGR